MRWANVFTGLCGAKKYDGFFIVGRPPALLCVYDLRSLFWSNSMANSEYAHIFNEVLRQALNLVHSNQLVLASVTIHRAFPCYEPAFFECIAERVGSSSLEELKSLTKALYDEV